MSVLIRGAGMPEACCTCPCSYDNQCAVNLKYPTFEEYHGSRPVWCPLIEVPTPHGRLIDADAIMREIESAERTMEEHGREYSFSFMSSGQEISTEWYYVEHLIFDATTIIPEEGET
jgi:hypothetical protein